jgi:hypothetical protein
LVKPHGAGFKLQKAGAMFIGAFLGIGGIVGLILLVLVILALIYFIMGRR